MKKKINLTNGGEAIVDQQDFDLVNQYSWYKIKDHNTYYAYTNIKGSTLKMHRLIMNPNQSDVIDHINKNGLDNRRSNLRSCSNLINCWNKDYNYQPYFNQEHQKYRIRFSLNKKEIQLGYLKNKENASNILNEVNILRKNYINNTISCKKLNDSINNLKQQVYKLRLEEGGKKNQPPKYKLYFEELKK